MSEIPVHSRPRRLADWINPTGAGKVHSLVDKVYQRKNLEMAWEKVKANRVVDVGSAAERTERGHLSASTGEAGANPEGGKAG